VKWNSWKKGTPEFDRAVELMQQNPRTSNASIGRIIGHEFKLDLTDQSLRKKIAQIRNQVFSCESESFIDSSQIDPSRVKMIYHKQKKDRVEHTVLEVFTPEKDDPKKLAEKFKELISQWQMPPIVAAPKYENENKECALFLNPADLHIGKRGVDGYDLRTASDRMLEGINGLLEKAKPYGIEKIFFVLGNDILHTDGAHGMTTKGTPQDNDGTFYDSFKTALMTCIIGLTACRAMAFTEVIYVPSNHDNNSGYMLAQAVACWFRNELRMDDEPKARKYSIYGNSLVMNTHFDKVDTTKLPMIMATEMPSGWAHSKYRYIYGGHLHHKKVIALDVGSVCVESMRSPAGDDKYHQDYGYVGSMKGIDAFIHHRKYGQQARITHLF
jgi:hypothetical protein